MPSALRDRGKKLVTIIDIADRTDIDHSGRR
jgi:hypothetical protein